MHFLIWVSMLGTHPDELVSRPLLDPALIFIFGHPKSPCLGCRPGCYPALSSCYNSLAPFPACRWMLGCKPTWYQWFFAPPPPSSCCARTACQTGGSWIVEGLEGTGIQRRLSLGSAWPTHSRKMNNPSQLQAGLWYRCRRSVGPWRGRWRKILKRWTKRWTWGRRPPLESWCLNRHWHHHQLSWRWLEFGRVV